MTQPIYDPQYDGRMIAATANIEALFTAVNHFEKMRVADAKRVEDLMATLTQQNQDILLLKQQVNIMQAKLYEVGVR